MPAAALLTDSLPADVSGWWASQKYDGVRAIWTGNKLLSRHGKDLKAPEWFTDGLPNRRLDGELWMGRGTFDELVSTIQKKGGDWEGVKFLIFDLAESGPVEKRIEAVERMTLPDHALPVKHVALASHADLDRLERLIVGMGGEGVVIRRPGSQYRPGRAGDTIKVKRMVADVDRWQG
jgi:DNA ligase-1